MRTLTRPVAALLLALLGSLTLVAPAQAADVYRYWAYFAVQDGQFVAQQTGPAGATPEDGAIEAYRFAAPADYENPNLPRADLSEVTFDAVCGASEAAEGEKRVAVLVDYGVEADSDGAEVPEPEAACAVVPADANGLQVLEAAAEQVRTEKSSFGPMLCGINGYPATGCADEKVDEGTPADAAPVDFVLPGDAADSASADAAAEEDGGNAGLIAGVAAVVAVLVGGGLLLRRRNA